MYNDLLPDGFLDVDDAPVLPDVLDMLIVGGGPAGTAAAFRAKELGLHALVIDFDDLMKRIRDYAKDKLILPHFGGGDRMRFPAGGELVASLQFDPIDKDDICKTWRACYRKYNVPAKIGIELTGFSYQSDGILAVDTWNHRTQQKEVIRARHLVLSIGRGVPRRFDIPGNTDGISYRLDDASLYVGRPACVIGGGTSAAEAVFAISNEKAKSGDECPVYWSYRGDKMPKVSRALSEAFFNAYLGNGNIRYYPNSEPVAILPGPDKEAYLSIRVDRRHITGRSVEATHLEFLKRSCIACIGEDIPSQFLGSLGVQMAKAGKKERMLVSPLLETNQPNVYLIGDMLSQRYLETADFAADVSTYREVRHPGNIKSALRDGVFVAEVVKQKLDGVAQVQVAMSFVEDSGPAETDSVGVKQSTSFIQQGVVEDAQSHSASGGANASLQPRIVRLTPAGVEEDEYVLDVDARSTIGMEQADINIGNLPSLQDIHASIYFDGAQCYLEDGGSTSGTFYRLPAGDLVEINDGDLVQLGRQFLVFGIGDGEVVCHHYNHQGVKQGEYQFNEGTKVLGRESPDITLDAADTVLSRRHLAVSFKDGHLYLKDLSSLNHSYLRVTSIVPLNHGDVFRLGQVVFQYNNANVLEVEPGAVSVPVFAEKPGVVEPDVEEPAADVSVEPAPESSNAGATGPSVTFTGHGGAFEASPDQTVLQIARANNIPINYECESGRCGYDPVRIVSGHEHLNEMDEDEEGWTLEEVCHLKPGEHRLACLLRTRGPVEVSIVEK